MSHCHSYSLKDTGSNDLFSLPSGAAPQVRQAAEEEEAAVGGQQTETGAGAEQGWFWLIFNNQRY